MDPVGMRVLDLEGQAGGDDFSYWKAFLQRTWRAVTQAQNFSWKWISSERGCFDKFFDQACGKPRPDCKFDKHAGAFIAAYYRRPVRKRPETLSCTSSSL